MRHPTNSVMLFLLLLGCGICVAVDAECEPGFADSCFTSVVTDLNYMLNLPEKVAKNISKAALDELCLALDDSLKCTADIIDGDCSEVEGKVQFDSWLHALWGPYTYVCSGEHAVLKDILQGIPCWSIDDFLRCTKAQAEIGHVRDLLHTELNKTECQNLKRVFGYCYDVGKVDSCREQQSIGLHVQSMIHIFFSESHCFEDHPMLIISEGPSLLPTLSLLLTFAFIAIL